MKKISIVLGIALLSLSSCVKDYTCTCTFTDTQPKTATYTPLESYTRQVNITGKKKDVRTTCERGSFVNGWFTQVCESN